MKVTHLDHIVLTVSDIERTAEFYQTVLGMRRVSFGEGRVALSFGNQKINLHQLHHEFDPKAGNVQVGSADLCFVLNISLEEAKRHLKKHEVEIIDGPVARTGATGPITSLYFRDPDLNLIEVSSYD
ncbi:MAG: biphenyl-2,3-diol 1,2-dioxygenase [Nitrospirales bacterium]|nr:MAG: biphenyl-2,3-diol 1,2-dioxygenase [Nitrospirales bacterium]